MTKINPFLDTKFIANTVPTIVTTVPNKPTFGNSTDESSDNIEIKNNQGGSARLKEAKKNILDNAEILNLKKEELDYIMNASYESENFGTARYDYQKDKIIVNANTNTDGNGQASTEDMIKTLIHEATHASKKSPFATKEEERECESRAIKETAKLVQSGKINSFDIYNADIVALANNDKVLNERLDEWLTGGYKNRVESLNTAKTTIYLDDKEMSNQDLDNSPKVEIKKGDKILVNGKEYPIGDFFVEGINRTNVCQLFNIQNNNPATAGIIVFDGSTQGEYGKQKLEEKTKGHTEQVFQLIRNDQVISTGKFY
ncbi:MAG: hypothetical protein WCF95_03365 [bacterium]